MLADASALTPLWARCGGGEVRIGPSLRSRRCFGGSRAHSINRDPLFAHTPPPRTTQAREAFKLGENGPGAAAALRANVPLQHKLAAAIDAAMEEEQREGSTPARPAR